MQGTVTDAEMVEAALERYREQYRTLALRCQSGVEATLPMGTVLEPSSVWEDGIRTDEQLPGTAVFVLECLTVDHEPARVLKSMRAWGYGGRRSDRRYVLVGSDEMPKNADMPEQYALCLPGAVILEVLELSW